MIHIHIQLAESGGYRALGLLGLKSRSGYDGRSCSTHAQEPCHVNFINALVLSSTNDHIGQVIR